MKKLLIPILFGLVLLSSCQEDSVTPITYSNKISDIYYEYERHDSVSTDNGQTWIESFSVHDKKTLREHWTWDGDKISSIDNYSELYDDKSFIFSYNNDLVSEIYAPDVDERMIFAYNNNQISKIDFYYEGELGMAWDLVYSNNKIVQMNSTCWRLNDKTAAFLKNLLNIDDENILNMFNSKDDLPYYTITWDGDNISMIEFNNSGMKLERTFMYDKTHNPYHGSNPLLALVLVKGDLSLMSANNVIKYKEKCLDVIWVTTKSCIYTYLYRNNYPTKKTNLEEKELTNPEYISKLTIKSSYYFNYLEN